MKRFTDSGRLALYSDNLYSALSLALTLPDICASLEDPGPGKSRGRYIRWAKQWVEPKFTGPVGVNLEPTVFLSAGDLYQLRCSLVHSGSAELDPNKDSVLNRFVFFDDSTGSHLNRFASVSINGEAPETFLQLKARDFSLTLFDAADEWDHALIQDENVQKEKAKLLVIRSSGFSIGGGAIVFG